MSNDGVKVVAVIGAGVIGASWAALFLHNGLEVIATDPAPGAETRLRAYVAKALVVLAELSAARPPSTTTDERLLFVEDIKPHLARVQFVQESGPENLAYKLAIFGVLDNGTSPTTIIASSSSGIPSSSFAGACTHADRVLIGHPYNPPHLIPLVEVVPSSQTSELSTARALDFYRWLGKTPVLLKKECPGFVANRLQAALGYEAYSLVARGIISARDLDLIVSNSMALRWAVQGPFITKALGGGGGTVEGFERHLAHIGKASKVWQDDMTLHRWQFSADDEQKLVESVREEFEELREVDLEKQRDSFVQSVLKLKSGQRG